jgi:hypothetical protein
MEKDAALRGTPTSALDGAHPLRAWAGVSLPLQKSAWPRGASNVYYAACFRTVMYARAAMKMVVNWIPAGQVATEVASTNSFRLLGEAEAECESRFR